MRALILVLILLVVGAIALVATGFVDLNQTRGAQVPNVGVSGNGVTVQGGQTPKFDVETGKIEVGTGQRTIPVPEIRIAPGGDSAAPQPPVQPAQPAPAPARPAPAGPATTDSTQR